MVSSARTLDRVQEDVLRKEEGNCLVSAQSGMSKELMLGKSVVRTVRASS